MDYREQALQVYINLMKVVNLRLDAIYKVQLAQEYRVPYRANQIEFCVLQIRKILENIALGSLVVNRDLYEKHYDRLEEMWQGKKILYHMEKVNPNFYPTPIVIDTSKKTHDWVPKKEGFLSKKDFENLYDKCAKMLHSESPFHAEKDVAEMYNFYEKNISIWCEKIVRLLDAHTIHLADGKTLLLIQMCEIGGDPIGDIFEQA